MKSLFLLCLAGFCVTARAVTIDFTPIETERTTDGVVFKQLTFYYPGGFVTYEQPMHWKVRGDSSGLRLTPETQQASAQIEQSALPAPMPWDENTQKTFRAQALASAPQGSIEVAFVADEQTPVRINSQETYGVTFSYKFFGQDYQANVLFVNFENTQLRFRTVAPKKDFENIFRAFRGSLFTMQWHAAQASP